MPKAQILYTKTDEAPALATYSLLPIVQAFTATARKAIALGAEAIIPGQLYLSEAIVRAGVTRIDEVPIVDGLAAVVKMAEVMADFRKLGISVTRRGYLHARPPQDVLDHARKFYK